MYDSEIDEIEHHMNEEIDEFIELDKNFRKKHNRTSWIASLTFFSGVFAFAIPIGFHIGVSDWVVMFVQFGALIIVSRCVKYEDNIILEHDYRKKRMRTMERIKKIMTDERERKQLEKKRAFT